MGSHRPLQAGVVVRHELVGGVGADARRREGDRLVHPTRVGAHGQAISAGGIAVGDEPTAIHQHLRSGAQLGVGVDTSAFAAGLVDLIAVDGGPHEEDRCVVDVEATAVLAVGDDVVVGDGHVFQAYTREVDVLVGNLDAGPAGVACVHPHDLAAVDGDVGGLDIDAAGAAAGDPSISADHRDVGLVDVEPRRVSAGPELDFVTRLHIDAGKGPCIRDAVDLDDTWGAVGHAQRLQEVVRSDAGGIRAVRGVHVAVAVGVDTIALLDRGGVDIFVRVVAVAGGVGPTLVARTLNDVLIRAVSIQVVVPVVLRARVDIGPGVVAVGSVGDVPSRRSAGLERLTGGTVAIPIAITVGVVSGGEAIVDHTVAVLVQVVADLSRTGVNLGIGVVAVALATTRCGFFRQQRGHSIA